MNPSNRGMVVALLAVVSSVPAFAQIDFSGEWAPLYHEDSPKRLPGPELGDYLELPINDAARMWTDSYDADRISVVHDLFTERNGDTWFVVTTVVEDPTYLTEPFVTSSNFKKQADALGFNPTPCSAR